jgi:hypothetical protein
MSTDSSVTYKDYLGTPQRKCMPWWISSLIAIRTCVIRVKDISTKKIETFYFPGID